jgi:serine/threonine-protein kinase
MAEGRYDEACPKFEESQTLDAGLGTQFHLANCWQRLGKTASAWALFREVASQAGALGQVGRERVARDRAEALEPWLSKLTISPDSTVAASSPEILRDGAEVGREQWNVSVPLDPGTHVVTVLAPGKQAWAATIDIPATGKTVTLSVPPMAELPELPSLVASPHPAPPASPRLPPPLPEHFEVGATSRMPESVFESPVLENRGSGQRAVGWTLVGAGIVGVGVGAYFGTQWLDDRGSALAHCNGNVCDAVGARLMSDARSQARYGIIAASVGGAALLAGVILVVSAPGPRWVTPQAVGIELAPTVGPREGGLQLRGAW